MKTLTNLTEKDAIEIVKAGYSTLIEENEYVFTSTPKHCTLIFKTQEIIKFEFYEQTIDFIRTINKIEIIGDVCFRCYITAHKLGYTIDELIDSNFKSKNNYFISFVGNKEGKQCFGNYCSAFTYPFSIQNVSDTITKKLQLKDVVILNYKEISQEELICNAPNIK